MSFYLYFTNGFQDVEQENNQQEWNNGVQNNYGNYSFYSFPVYSQNSLMMGSMQPEEPLAPTNHEGGVEQSQNRVQQQEKPKKREKNLEKQIESAKKNGESNLINHFFSYYSSRQKSQEVVRNCIELTKNNNVDQERILYIFYHAIQFLRVKRNKRYVNKFLLHPLIYSPELEGHIPDIKNKLEKTGFQPGDLCEVFRKCIYYFYRNICINSIATSRRITLVAKPDHFKRRRKLSEALFQKKN